MIVAGLCVLCWGKEAVAQTDPQPQNKSIVIRPEGYQEPKEPELKDLTFKQRLRFGGNFGGLSIGNPTSVGVSPMLGYQLTNQAILGVGGTYQYYSYRDFYNNRYTSNAIAYRAFIMQNISVLQQLLGGGYLQAEVEKYESLSGGFSYQPSFLVGLGLGSPRSFNLTVLYNLNYKDGYDQYGRPYSIYSSPLVLRVGGFFF